MAPQTSGTPSLPERIGDRYRIDGLLGRGGMAVVLRAHDLQLDRAVALKCVLADGEGPRNERLHEMLAREYRILLQLSHPSVITVYEYGVTAQGPYYTMELLDGCDLHELSPVPWRAACAYLRDVASCVALLHSRRWLHRDVSPRNIRCSRDRAKLLDFGALAQMGHLRQLVGTPPLVPPEALHGQALDGRSDLYSLGATLYWSLTRRHAYPAHSLHELPRQWGVRPAPPSHYAPDVPEALDALVMSLLSHEVGARARTASEVMERLTRIAGLDDDETLHVSQSYLNTPSLQGRDGELAEIRDALTRTRRERSRALWLEGEPGVGRSRLLEAALLDARLTGVTVLHVAAGDVAPGDLAVARELLSRATDQLERTQDGPTSQELLAAFERGGDPTTSTRLRVVSRARAVVRRACARQPLVIAVDDVDLADIASQALLASLLRSTRRNLLLLLTARPNHALDAALSVRRSSSDPIVLRPLLPTQTEALLASVFGDVPGVPAVSARVHELSHGNPRATMELAEHLVLTGKARYGLGAWELPLELARSELPAAWTNALDARLAALSGDARELLEVLAFAFEHGITGSALDTLTSHGESERRRLAVDELLTAALVRLDGDDIRFVRGGDRERVIALASASRVRALHARLTQQLASRAADPIAIARCQQRAGDDGGCIDTLLAELARGTRADTAPNDYAALLEHAITACSSLSRPRAQRFQLLRELVKVGDHLGVTQMPSRFAELFAQLRNDSGLDDYEALPGTLEPLARLERALATAQARHDALPSEDRVLTPIEAIQEIAMTVRQAAAFGAVALDYELIETLPSLAAFTPLSDMLRTTVEHTLPASAHLTAGRYESARDGYLVTLDRLEQPDRGGLAPEFWRWAVNALRFALGHINAGLGIADALRYARLLEGDATWLIGAWDVRRAYFLRQGDWREAEACRDRIERLRLQSDRRPPMVDTSARLELDASAHAGDLLGVRRATERLGELIARHPGYAPYAHYGPAVCEHLRGNQARALPHIDRALALVTAGRHPTWPWIASCRIDILLALGRDEQARTDGLTYLAQAQAAKLEVMADHITLPLSLAEARLGDFESAVARAERAIRYREALGSTGLNLGWAYEARARIAIWMRDQAGFTAAAAVCAREYGRGRGGSSFAPKYEALRAEARQAGLLSASEAPAHAAAEAAPAYLSTLSGSTSHEERLTLALALLVEASGAEQGILYRSIDGAPVRCAQSDATLAPAHALALAASVLSSTRDDDDDDGATAHVAEPLPEREYWRGVALGHTPAGRFQITGVALLRFAAAQVGRPIGSELIELVRGVLASAPSQDDLTAHTTARSRDPRTG